MDTSELTDNVRDMIKTTETLRIMAGLERRLNKLSDLEARHCGHGELVNKAERYREKLMDWIESNIEALARKAGCQ